MAQQTILNTSNLLHTAAPAGFCLMPEWKSYVPVRKKFCKVLVTAMLKRGTIGNHRMDQQVDCIQRPDLVPIQA